jgi:ubiquinone/menaquinone biosynthesis C-methylase UbiE
MAPLPRPPEPETDPDAVRRQWETIGPAFDETRRHPWDEVLDWAEEALPGLGWSLDLACGNGRHGRALAAEGHDVVGVDAAGSLVEAARRRWEDQEQREGRFAPVQADARDLPLAGNRLEGGLFVAGIHNIPSRTGRVGALAEMARVLSPGAPALVTAWALWQDRWLETVLRELPGAWLSGRDPADRPVPWRRGQETVDRTYHLYRRRELAEEMRAAGFRDVEVEGRRLTDTRLPDNWFATGRAP